MSNDMSCDANVAAWPHTKSPGLNRKVRCLRPIAWAQSAPRLVRSPGLFSNLKLRVINKPWFTGLV